jgi:hypothetical protein
LAKDIFEGVRDVDVPEAKELNGKTRQFFDEKVAPAFYRSAKVWMEGRQLFRFDEVMNKPSFIFEGSIKDFQLSPNKKRVAVSGYGGLYVLNADGSCVVKLSEGHGKSVKWVDNDTVEFRLSEGYVINPYVTYKLNDSNSGR